ncbi:hypothetical protein N9L83_00535 [Flavobacteriales bacterium]|nr:hypothetical protein [Flavobacteriales bacterium]
MVLSGVLNLHINQKESVSSNLLVPWHKGLSNEAINAVFLVAVAAVQKLMQILAKEQEVLMHIADMMIWTYAAEPIVLRV